MAKMDRRTFIRTGMAAGSLISVSGYGCRQAETESSNAADKPAQNAAAISVPALELDEKTITDLQEDMKSAKYTCRSIVEKYLQRIEELNATGTRLYAGLETNPGGLQIADQLDRERKEKGPRGPLHGIPLLLKDNIDTADKMTMTAGSTALRGSI